MVIGQTVFCIIVLYKVVCLFSSTCIKTSESWAAKEEKVEDKGNESQGHENGSSAWTTSWTS